MCYSHPPRTRTGHQVSTPHTFPPLAYLWPPSSPGMSVLMDYFQERSLAVDNSAPRRRTRRDKRGRYRRQLITLDMLPDDVLLEIFHFCNIEDFRIYGRRRIMWWKALAHVCRRWRTIVFQSPRRLNLRLLCTSETPPRGTLDIWPPFLLIIRDFDNVLWAYHEASKVANIIAALEHNDRVCQIDLGSLTSSELGYVTGSAAMQKPFPELTNLQLKMHYDLGAILPDSFLGGTAPRLRSLYLDHVPFPGLPNLLLSATNLVKLDLFHRISHSRPSGYIPPEVMATSLSALTNLESFCLRFLDLPPALETRRPPPPTRSILPSLTIFVFQGASEYLEEILAPIDAPRLTSLRITFFYQIIFDTPQLFQFISRSPTLRAPEKAHIIFGSQAIFVRFPSQTSNNEVLSMDILCTATERQLSSLKQVCTSSLPPVSTLEDLYILEDRNWPPLWQGDVENTLWLRLLRPFVAVKNLYLSREIVPHIAPVLQELGEGRTTEVFPTLRSLQNLFLEGFQPSGSLYEGIEKYVAARRLTSHPVAVSGFRFRYHLLWSPDRYDFLLPHSYFLTS